VFYFVGLLEVGGVYVGIEKGGESFYRDEESLEGCLHALFLGLELLLVGETCGGVG
jgi:hypothetical protein